MSEAIMVDIEGLLSQSQGQNQEEVGKAEAQDGETKFRTNARAVRCNKCDSAVLPIGKGSYEEREFELKEPYCNRDKDGQGVDQDSFRTEKLGQCYVVQDMFDFDNIGFSKAVGDVQYLLCADCEVGPIGYFDKATKKSYLALARVKHQTPPPPKDAQAGSEDS